MTPRVDVLEDDSGITLVADMPGVAKESLEIKVENDALSIEGAITAATPQALEATYAEVRIPRYRRSFTSEPRARRGPHRGAAEGWSAEAAHSETRAGATAAHFCKSELSG